MRGDEPMMDDEPPFSWAGFLVQFFFGAILGALFGFRAWARSSWGTSPEMFPGMYFVIGGALIVGLIAGFFGDRFWKDFIRRWWW